jgi:hypothetical protein
VGPAEVGPAEVGPAEVGSAAGAAGAASGLAGPEAAGAVRVRRAGPEITDVLPDGQPEGRGAGAGSGTVAALAALAPAPARRAAAAARVGEGHRRRGTPAAGTGHLVLRRDLGGRDLLGSVGAGWDRAGSSREVSHSAGSAISS